MTVMTPTQSYAEMSGIPNYMISDGNQAQLQQVHHDDPISRNARIRLDYKKSFQDDLIFFPEPKNENLSMIDTNFVFQRPQHKDQHNSQKDNLVLLMALKRQQQQQQQFYQNQLAMRKGANDTFYHQPLQHEQHYGENYMSPQNVYNYMNLRARG
ncbi:hypothetical protein ZYGR_0N02310 [Zygosaccharomyces rouxii]|uniref:ZYRO0D05610p n=2 Tax=Zygosaccharomyces rouxii TaxID=4956 RepID=C5DVC6_ZYGRC|nr:uncharacterized protein ZYRO0D05610g [Zygosaccharomyces rouxii]KAH9200658.1 hypothetical protein LQ764DRAFT_97418 [Zygosaccharomyces rouxii]GAV48826.1 hypothetical protein ZYGR_0N02310 [Zygosaccharomyces rouxii]CAR27745.1 ZYRO0D05610p [Zygosaccharomyces rouxii]